MQVLADLLPSSADVQLETIAIQADEQRLDIHVTAIQPSVRCPGCNHASCRIHSRYQRRLSDLPWAGFAARLVLQTRRWFCDNPVCRQRIFAERLPNLAAARGRRTNRLAAAQQQIGLALGGAAGARLAADLAMPAGIDLLLTLVRQAPVAVASTAAHIGIDDWAKRKAHHYGTIIVDLDTGRPMVLLNDRCADQVASWLQTHPEVRVVSRDRGQVYVEGVTRGAPHAVQVADRWPLLKNLGEALLQVFQQHQRTITEVVAPSPVADVPEGALPAAAMPPPAADPVAPQCSVSAADHRRQARYHAIHDLQQRGWSQTAIARHLNLERKTVRTYLRMGETFRPRQRSPRGSRLEPFTSYLLERWNGGCHNAMQLLRELHAQGFTGKRSIVRSYLGFSRDTRQHRQ